MPYEKLARLHGRNVLATTVVQTCIRYGGEDQRCRFCTIEESLRSGATTAVKRPAELAEVAEAAVRLDGVTQMVMTTGTSAGTDRGARHLARCVRAVKAAVPNLPSRCSASHPPTWRYSPNCGRRVQTHRHPCRIARRGGATALDARQGHGADGQLSGRVA